VKLWSPQAIATIDMLYCLVAGLIVLMAEPSPKIAAADKPICQLAVDAVWADALPVDVDLWVRAPGDTPVGYSAKDGTIFNLVRDDLGTVTVDNSNSERACARVIADGDYIVNVHLYNHGSPPPIPVTVTVSFVDPAAATMTQILSKQVVLESKGQEITVVRFKMKDDHLVTGSEHDIPVKLRHGSNDPGVQHDH
jgi:hypothetical protein